jgi:hypothetical protein
MRFIALCLIAVVFLVSCGPPPIRQLQKVDGITIGLEHPEQARLNQEVDLIVTVTDAEDRTVNNAIVTLDLTMPEMPMGQNRPIADSLGGGRYRVRAALTMVGEWTTTVIVLLDGKEYRAVFKQMVRA